MDNSLKSLKGLGPKRISALAKMGIKDIESLLSYMPRAYKDLSHVQPIAALMDGDDAVVLATVVSAPSMMRLRKGLTLVKCMIADGSGRAECVWFNQAYITGALKQGEQYILYGKVRVQFGKAQLGNPMWESWSDEAPPETMLPIYTIPRSVMSQKLMRACVREALTGGRDSIQELFSPALCDQYKLVTKEYAIDNIHFPSDADALETARKRLAFEELLLFQYSIREHKKQNRKYKEKPLRLTGTDIETFLSLLRFAPTMAQRKALQEITDDLIGELAMNRLVQGDVGSGKTVTALFAMYAAYVNGAQSALMVPTEILAKQHFLEAEAMFSALGVQVVLLTGGMKGSERKAVLAQIRNGEADMIIGTHALFQKDVEYQKLAVVVTDEQHRFGVRQRAAVSAKGSNPDVLVMSATPIPRTLALLLYGDLDISVIDELPPGRKKIKTYVIEEQRRKDMYDYLAARMDEGRQGYIICPLVEDPEEGDGVSAEELYSKLTKGRFAKHRVGLMHGRLSAAEKNEVMSKFAQGQLQLLVSTTVVEVGVNVPNATFIVIEDSGRFGLAQLHQLRGRVGRGEHESFCFLMVQADNIEAKNRLNVLVQTNDGFKIAERDMELRGPGDFLGTRQSGLPDIKMARYLSDMSLVKLTKEAIALLDSDTRFMGDKKRVEELVNERMERASEDIAFN